MILFTFASSAFKSEIFPFLGAPTRILIGIMEESRQKKITFKNRFFGTGTGTERHMKGSNVMLTFLHDSSGQLKVDFNWACELFIFLSHRNFAKKTLQKELTWNKSTTIESFRFFSLSLSFSLFLYLFISLDVYVLILSFFPNLEVEEPTPSHSSSMSGYNSLYSSYNYSSTYGYSSYYGSSYNKPKGYPTGKPGKIVHIRVMQRKYPSRQLFALPFLLSVPKDYNYRQLYRSVCIL